MAYEDNVWNARDNYAKNLKLETIELSRAQANQNIDEVLNMVDANLPGSRMTAQEMTDHIRRVVPTYHFDCSEENLARQKLLHDKARAALHKRSMDLYRDDPYSCMGRKVWGEDRSAYDYGPYVGKFMGEEYKKELEALAKMVDEGKRNEPEFIDRSRKLHTQINLHATSIADQKREEYSHLTPEEMIDRYDEIYAFCRLGDTTNCSVGLSPEEQVTYHQKMNPMLNTLGIVMSKVGVYASDLGDKMDVEQLTLMGSTQRDLIRGSQMVPPYLSVPSTTTNTEDPILTLDFASSQMRNELIDHLEKNYPQFEVQYNTKNEGGLYANGFDRDLIYQTTDGRVITKEGALEEIMQFHRPIYVSTGNDPSAKPVLAYMNNGRPCSGSEAEEVFRSQNQADQERELGTCPPIVHKTKLGFFSRAWNGFCNLLEKLPFGVNADSLRTDDMIAYNQETEVYENVTKPEYETHVKEYKEKTQKNQELCEEKLTDDEKVNAIREELFKSRPELKQKVKETDEKKKGIDLIVEKLTDSACAQNEGLRREDVLQTIKKGDTLSKMIADKDSLERYAKMAKEQPEALFAEYGQRLQQASKEDAKHANEPEKTLTQSKVLENEKPAIEKQIQY